MTKKLLALFIFAFIFPVSAHAVEPSIIDKVDQMIIIGFRGTNINRGSDIEGILKNTNVGGVVLFDYDSPTRAYGRNIKTHAQLKTLTDSLNNEAKTPLLIAIDEEGGKVSRLKKLPGFKPLPSAEAMSLMRTADVEEQSRSLAQTISSLGINTNFAPVLDLTNTNQNAPLTKQDRTFSAIPGVVSSYATAFIEGMKSHSIVTSGKHFPGLGEAMLDSHQTLPIVRSKDNKHLEPYRNLNNRGLLDSVMVAHIIDTRVDSNLPASLSEKHIDILRKDIGFNGVIITDDLDMGAIKNKYSSEKAAVLAIKAGADMVIVSNNISSYNPKAFYAVRNEILKAIGRGEIHPKRIDESFNRITSLKTKYGIIK